MIGILAAVLPLVIKVVEKIDKGDVSPLDKHARARNVLETVLTSVGAEGSDIDDIIRLGVAKMHAPKRVKLLIERLRIAKQLADDEGGTWVPMTLKTKDVALLISELEDRQ